MDGFGIPGTWMANFTINGTPITDITGFESFKMVEEAGNQLPTFKLMFKTTNTGLLSYLNEGNVLIAGMGVTQLDLSGIKLRPMSKDISKADSASLRFQVNGFYDALDYSNNTNVQISDKKSGISFMNDLVSKYFTPDFSTSASNDSMNWIQHGIPDKEMVQQLWTRSDLGNKNFPMIAITSDGSFRLRTANDLVKGDYQWIFDNSQPVGGKVVPFHYDYNIKSDTGFTNYSAAYQQTSDIIDLDKGPGSLFSTTITQFFGQSASLEQAGSIAGKIFGNLISNLNHHQNFHQAHADNVSNMANTSSTKLYISNSDIFFPVKCLDVILFTDTLMDGTSVQSFSGLWVVTQVTRSIDQGRFCTQLTCVRESMNNVQVSS